MKLHNPVPLILFCLSGMLLGCSLTWLIPATPTPTPTPSEPRLTVDGILQNFAEYEDQLVQVSGYGVIEAMMPLCEGYVGLDTRMVFVDEEENNLTARLAGNLWEAMKGNDLRDFLGYVRIFSGDMGCPGNVGMVSFPYFEIVEVLGSE